MTAVALMHELERRHVRPEIADDGIKLIGPRSAFTPDLVEQARAHKPALLAVVTADEALALLQRLKTFTVPARRMAVVNQLVAALAPFARASDSAALLGALRDFERELITLGGAPDPELAQAVGLVTATFPRRAADPCPQIAMNN